MRFCKAFVGVPNLQSENMKIKNYIIKKGCEILTTLYFMIKTLQIVCTNINFVQSQITWLLIEFILVGLNFEIL